MKRIPLYALSLIVGLVGCTEPGEMTGVGAVAGGTIGAGLGAIIGNQTGDAGAGIAIGAVSGAAAGAAIGNAMQAQDETTRSQDEAIERQQAMLAANQRDLEQLRGTRDPVSSNSVGQQAVTGNYSFPSRYQPPVPGGGVREVSPRASYSVPKRAESVRAEPVRPAAPAPVTSSVKRSPPAPRMTTNDIQERDIAAPSAAAVISPAEEIVEKPIKESVAEEIVEAPIVADQQPAKVAEQLDTSDDCKRAAGEVIKGNESREIADRLFHYRRALRLCPNNAEYHNLLGETYISLNRTVDAEFEFREALKINPELEQAKSNLAALR